MYNILFFDGECRFCNRWVQWVVDRDEERYFKFASLQSNFAKEIFLHYNIAKDFNSIAILKNNQSDQKYFLTKSEAVAFLFSILKPNAFLYKLIKLTPRLLSDFGYDCIAAVRKFLPVADCRLFTDEEKTLFLDDYKFDEWLFHLSNN